MSRFLRDTWERRIRPLALFLPPPPGDAFQSRRLHQRRPAYQSAAETIPPDRRLGGIDPRKYDKTAGLAMSCRLHLRASPDTVPAQCAAPTSPTTFPKL